MKLFEDKPVEHKQTEPPVVDSSVYIKQNLMKSVDRNNSVRQAVERWLFSFEGGITKAMFEQQMKRLDRDDEKALSQLDKAIGRRTIPLAPPPKNPPLPQPLYIQMVEDTYVAVHGRKFKSQIKEAVTELSQCGDVYVLSMEELIVQFKGYSDKGRSPQMIQKAIDCDFLIVVDLEMPLHLEWHINEAICRIGRMREAAGKPIISTWCRFNDCNEFFKRFHIYEVS